MGCGLRLHPHIFPSSLLESSFFSARILYKSMDTACRVLTRSIVNSNNQIPLKLGVRFSMNAATPSL